MRCAKGVWVFVLAGLVACCSSTAATSDGGVADPSHSPDRPAVDATGVADDRPAAHDLWRPTRCSITGSTPVAAHLAGDGYAGPDAGPPSSLRQELDLYLPLGRASGAPVLLAFATYWPARSLTVIAGRVNADGGAAGLDRRVDHGGPLSFRGRMAAPSGGLDLQLSGNRNFANDQPVFVVGEASLCPAGDVPAPTLRATDAVTPRGVARLLPSAPIGEGAAGVRLLVDGAAVPASAAVQDGALLVTALAPLPPGAPVTVDPGGLRDVMGRAFALEGSLRTLATTAVVADLEFATAPPAGAVDTDGEGSVVDGALVVSPGPDRGPYRALLALGALRGATSLRVQLRLRCDPAALSLSIVGRTGATTALPVGPLTREPSEVRGPLPDAGPWWLLIENRATPPRPGWRSAGACPVQIDRIVAE